MNRAINHKQEFTGTIQITLVSISFNFKNIDIWLSYGPNEMCMPIFGNTYFSHNSAILHFGPIGLKIIMGTQETKYYLSIGGEESKLWCLCFIFDFFEPLVAGNGRGLQKFDPTDGIFGPTTIYLEIMFSKFTGWTLHPTTIFHEGFLNLTLSSIVFRHALYLIWFNSRLF